jgi:hypothetical protein
VRRGVRRCACANSAAAQARAVARKPSCALLLGVFDIIDARRAQSGTLETVRDISRALAATTWPPESECGAAARAQGRFVRAHTG